ncbi:CHAT domain-containing protein [Carboxylicivirga sp. RSCT41]|uniref:CHAT domain-containing protein n=1 Tax=Carboxylicivirga agarovorans TaxID=3417570 RepID=UPI003D344B10
MKKSYSSETDGNIILFTKYYSDENFEKAAEIGARILIDTNIRPECDEQYRLLYKTIRSIIYSSGYNAAYNFLIKLEQQSGTPLFHDFVRLYKGIFSITVDKHKQAKTILNSLLQENNTLLLNDSVKAKIYHNLALLYQTEGKHIKRLEYLTKSFELEKKSLLNNSNFENYNLSVETYTATLFNKYKQYEKAYRVFQEALSLPFNKNINVNNHALYHNYIDLLFMMGMEEKTRKYIKELLLFYEGKNEYYLKDYTSLLNTLAYHYYLQKNYTNSILYATQVLSLSHKYNTSNYNRHAAYNYLARCYYELQQYDKMLYYFKEDIRDCKERKRVQLTEAYLYTGHYLAKIYEDEAAFAYIDSAKNCIYNQFNLAYNNSFENRIALAYYELEQYNQCLYHLENVSHIMRSDSNYTAILVWDNKYEKALCYQKLKDYHKAYKLLNEANNAMLNKYPPLQDKSSSIQSSKIGELYRKINIILAENLNSQYHQSGEVAHLEEAMLYIDEAGKSIEILRGKQNYDRDRRIAGEWYFNFTEQSAKVTMDLFEATGDTAYLHKAFEYIQKGKAYALMQGINEKKYKLNSGVPLEMINELNTYKKQYDRYEKRYNDTFFSSTIDSSLVASLSSHMTRSMASIDSINALIKDSYPEYSEEKARAPFLSIEQIQERLGKDQVIVDYYQTDSEIFRFAISTSSIQCDVIKTDRTLKECIAFVTKEVSTPFIGQSSKEHIQQFAAASYELYKKLLNGLEHMVTDKELIIVPHGELSYLPFEVLLTEDVSSDKPKFSDYPWLIKKQTISYSYNTALLSNYSSKPIPFNKVLAFAPDYSGSKSGDSIHLSTSLFLDSLLMPLQGAREEIASIEKLYNTQSFTNQEANRNNFIASMQDNHVLHLSMHSLNDEVQPFNSQLVFASTDSVPGSFTAGEIYNYNIKSPLAVLSSCSTGRGHKQKGEGLLSIARAFTYSGVDAQVMTLWPVNDKSGANIVEEFYRNLEIGLDKNKALQASKLNYLANADGVKSHPYYWANYVLAGNTSALKQQMPKGLFVYLLAFAIISVILFFFYDRRRS